MHAALDDGVLDAKEFGDAGFHGDEILDALWLKMEQTRFASGLKRISFYAVLSDTVATHPALIMQTQTQINFKIYLYGQQPSCPTRRHRHHSG
jgi:hypothetical protein